MIDLESTSNKLPNRTQILKLLYNIETSFFKKYNIILMYLGGSLALGTNNWWSDIDIFILNPSFTNFPSNKKLDYLMDLTNELNNILDQENVQVSIIDKLPLHVQFSVIKDGILVYQKNELERINFTENVLRFYYDHKIWYERMLDESLGNH